MAEITKNTDERRFEITVDGELAGWLDYRLHEGEVVALPHTFVEERFSGQGLASELVRFGLDDIRSQGYLVNPECPYVANWIEKHPDYADLVADADSAVTGAAADDMEQVTGVDPDTDPRI